MSFFRRPYSYCPAKRHFDVFGKWVSFEKTCLKFCRSKTLKHNRI